MEFEKEIKFRPAFDRRNSDPNKNYGIHGVEMTFYLKGELGTIQFVVYTNWQLPHVQKESLSKCDGSYCHLKPMATDIGYHSPVPQYEGQTLQSKSCSALDGKPCYYDGSSLNAEPIFEKLLSGGDDAVWAEMEEWYNNTFINKQ